MHQEKLIAKIIDLEERANAHTAEYQRLLHVPKSKTEASKHHRKAVRLQSRIQEPHQGNRPLRRTFPFLPQLSRG